ncbi:MAG: tyrosine--tRNA ligase [Flavobacteriales bacterium TMED96]|nr:MAG: tyrosine--tRNA ligase [Flavobacteriales bacterium TMED96]
MRKSFLDELKWRGMLHQFTPDVDEHLSQSPRTGYIGFDPTSDSMHIGNLVQIMILIHFQRYGHKPIALIGGATGMIGDPSGKSSERKLLDQKKLKKNSLALKKQFLKFLNFSEKHLNSAEMINNFDWIKEFSLIDFSREVGKHITVNYMMSKESVKKRISDESSEGMSFTEFTYQLIQGYDFLELFRNKKCTIQIGGSDQWGNITTGMELIRKKLYKKVYSITCPLMTKSDGSKFGKTEQGNIWLDKSKTSPYKFYQYWLNLSDKDAEKYIKIFTLLNKNQILELIEKHKKNPHERILQNKIAEEVTFMVHSQKDLENAKIASKILFGKSTKKDLSSLDKGTFYEVFDGVPKVKIKKSFLKKGLSIVEALSMKGSILNSLSEARRALNENSVYINKSRVDENKILDVNDLIIEGVILIQRGKKKYIILDFTD